MDWRTVRFDWNRARAFLVTAEEGSLSAAARALGLAQPTLSRQVEALEQELGVTLFERAGRRMQLTASGHELLVHVRDMGAAASRFSLTAFGQNDDMAGKITISVGEVSATLEMPSLIKKLQAKEPRIAIEIVATSESSNLSRREADLAIRNYRPTDPDLIARKIRVAKAHMYATPEFVAKHGPFNTVDDLRNVPFIGFSDVARMIDYLNAKGLSLTQANFTCMSENFMVAWTMTLQGLGIGIQEERLAAGYPELVQVLADFPPIEFDIWLVAHRELHHNPRLRFVFDFLAEALK